CVYTLSAFFREIPWELEKAAKMDGATPAQAFRQVIAPLAVPGVVTAAILVFIAAWNDLLFGEVHDRHRCGDRPLGRGEGHTEQ
ncbi:ABC transporter permease subunit, partial [Mycobacterium kansasii]